MGDVYVCMCTDMGRYCRHDGYDVCMCVQTWGGTAGMMDTMEKTSKPDKDNKVISRLKSRTEIDSYAECYPG